MCTPPSALFSVLSIPLPSAKKYVALQRFNFRTGSLLRLSTRRYLTVSVSIPPCYRSPPPAAGAGGGAARRLTCKYLDIWQEGAKMRLWVWYLTFILCLCVIRSSVLSITRVIVFKIHDWWGLAMADVSLSFFPSHNLHIIKAISCFSAWKRRKMWAGAVLSSAAAFLKMWIRLKHTLSVKFISNAMLTCSYECYVLLDVPQQAYWLICVSFWITCLQMGGILSPSCRQQHSPTRSPPVATADG